MEAIHKKTGKKYNIINATNENDGQIMVLYSGKMKDGDLIGTFVREKKEFFDRFEI